MYYIRGESMISVRLPSDFSDKLEIISKNENKTKSEIIKQALKMYFDNYEKNNSAYESGKYLFGKYGSNKSNLSKDYKKILRDKLNEKYSD